MATQIVRDWWRENGNTIKLSFDFSGESQSLDMLISYINNIFGGN